MSNPVTQLGRPVSSRRAVCAGLMGVTAFAAMLRSRKTLFDSMMVSVFVTTFATCVPLTLDAPGTGKED